MQNLLGDPLSIVESLEMPSLKQVPRSLPPLGTSQAPWRASLLGWLHLSHANSIQSSFRLLGTL